MLAASRRPCGARRIATAPARPTSRGGRSPVSLHDADYDRWPEEHPRSHRRLAPRAGRARDRPGRRRPLSTRPDVPELTTLDKALLACDELTGFVMACCLVRPDGIRSLSPSSVKKKLKDKSFAAKVNRDDVY